MGAVTVSITLPLVSAPLTMLVSPAGKFLPCLLYSMNPLPVCLYIYDNPLVPMFADQLYIKQETELFGSLYDH